MKKHPIGIFDSGVGGLCVLKEIKTCLPHESIIYFADSKNCPYGSKAKEEAFDLARKHIEFLLELSCKLIVIACNTVTAVAIDYFRSKYEIPFIGMEPALKPAALQTKTKKIGILATENTFNGKLFKQNFEKYGRGVEIFIQPGNGLVELVEKGEHNSEQAFILLNEYLSPMLAKGADTIVLGCTHYPFLKNIIESITQDNAAIVDPAGAVAAHTKNILTQSQLISSDDNEPMFQFYTTGKKQIALPILLDIIGNHYNLEIMEI